LLQLRSCLTQTRAMNGKSERKQKALVFGELVGNGGRDSHVPGDDS
jgi:hypothetical protein